MNGNKLLRLALWEGTKWYLRRAFLARLPTLRRAALASAGALLAAGVVSALVRRANT